MIKCSKRFNYEMRYKIEVGKLSDQANESKQDLTNATGKNKQFDIRRGSNTSSR